VRRERVEFMSGKVPCAGYLFRPDPEMDPHERLPSIILAHGVSGTMDRLIPHAERFASAGFAALVFDYRGFGESGGEPRQVVDISDHHQDIRAAVAWVRGREDLDSDRVALWGSSLAGAHVITVAADDPGIVAVVAQIPFTGFPGRVRGRRSRDSLKLLAAMLWDSLKGLLRLKPYYRPMVGRPGELAVTTSGEARRHIEMLTGGDVATRWKNEVAPRGLLQMTRYRPATDAARLQAALLVCIATEDEESPEALTAELANRAPHGTLRRYAATHFDFYSDPSLRDRVFADQVEFLQRMALIDPSRRDAGSRSVSNQSEADSPREIS
jgi:uncharacterized protein